MNIFKHVTAVKPKRSTFNLSHDVKLTGDFGTLIPFMCEEVVPSDTWKVKSDVLLRMTPLIAPVMHKINVYTHFFYVPYRLVWDQFEEFITGGDLGQSNPTFPRLKMLGGVEGDFYDEHGQWAPGSLADYLGFPTSDTNRAGGGMSVSALPFRAYQMIYNEYYRDENLQPELDIDLSSDEPEVGSVQYNRLLSLRHRSYAKDYFTSALPWTQKGSQQTVPLIGRGTINHPIAVPVDYTRTNENDEIFSTSNLEKAGKGAIVSNVLSASPQSRALAAGNSYESFDLNESVSIDNSKHLSVNIDGTSVSLQNAAFTINDLRRANAIQKWLERNARGGSRYIESLLSHFGVISDDLRLQRPEFLGGGKTPVTISDVLQTSQTDTTPQGQYTGLGFSLGTNNTFKRSFKERGMIIGILSVMPHTGYMEGLRRQFHKFDRFDYYWPEFAHLGEQEIYNYELALRSSGHLTETFGYAPRFAEYKYIPSRVHGDFKTTLKYWHLDRGYETQPTLNNSFVQVDAQAQSLNRIFATEGEEAPAHMLIHVHNDVKARRPMPYLPDPSL